MGCRLVVLAAWALAAAPARASRDAEGSRCEGEFQPCPNGECSLVGCEPAVCGAGEYRCPMSDRCVAGVSAYRECPGLAGTHLDPALPLEARLDYLVNVTTLEEQIGELANVARGVPRLGLPARASGVRRTDSTRRDVEPL